MKTPVFSPRFLLTGLLLVGFLLAAVPLQAKTTAFVGATLHPVNAEPLEEGVLLVEEGRILALGPADQLEIPAHAQVVNLAGLHIYPGLIHADTVLGLTEIGSVAGTEDGREGGPINAALRTDLAFNADSMLLAPNITNGVLTAHVVPRGSLISGRSAVMRLAGWNYEDMRLLAPAGMHLTFPEPGEDDSELKLLEQTLDRAEDWSRAMLAWRDGKAPRPAHNDQLESLVPLLEGELRLFIHAADEETLAAALDWVAERGLAKPVLVGGPDLQHLTERLAEEQIDVILTGVQVLPARRWEPYDAAYVAAGRLAEAGVRFAITDGGSAFVAGNVRNIAFHAGMATAFGLSEEAALKSLTLWPAEILGLGQELGSLEAGKRASFFVTDGSPLEATSEVLGAWLDGEEYDFSRDRQRQLYYRYRQRP